MAASEQERRVRYLAAVVPLLMVAVAAVQVQMVRVHGMSPWKGGGFGMFSSPDGPGNRSVRLVLRTSDGVERPAVLPDDVTIARIRAQARVLPTEDRLRTLARWALTVSWAPSPRDAPPGQALLHVATSSDANAISVAAATVTVWRLVISADQVRPEMIASVQWPKPRS